ncbi:MAG: undecaprenyl/decaprenyl-phosphate alpha-N-acetylglucosaminyl 1-phosphate transferase [Candidatus Omnitrophica bacterium]|nr:undecaprenyl/decaprenyl-phosphate alpha-N-acetylglucosaminyl 1-phosphate transferase [Candidatus Omnitrophota bacterium]
MAINYLFITLSGFLTGTFLMFFLKKLSLRYRIFSQQGIPLVGGIAMGLSFMIASGVGFLLLESISREVKGVILASCIMLVFGAIDDWKELSILTKFFVQLIATTCLIFFGIRTQIVTIANTANIIITFIWVLGITNAFNHLDILDGLAGSTAIIVSLAFFIISFLHGDRQTAALTLALAGAIFGFLIYNFPPAKVYMGNAGSHFLGFLLAAIALSISYAPLERKVALASPLLILGLPIYDTAFLILIRTFKKTLPFKKTNDHLALRFLALGYSNKKTLFSLLGLGLFFSLCGILVSQASNLFSIIIIAFVILVALALSRRMSEVSI